MAVVQPQWELSQNAGGVLLVTRDLLAAATADNVQVQALAACEKFGGTLAVSRRVATKVENLIRRQSRSTTLEFIKATVGYAKGRSLKMLGQSVAGINFLCIAAALIATGSTYLAAQTFELLLETSAIEKEDCPGVLLVKALLDVLEPDLVRTGFLDDVFGYARLVSDISIVNGRNLDTVVPQPEIVAKVNQAFREIGRLGQAENTTLVFKASRFVPWLAAFTRWSVDTDAAIFWHDGRAIIESSTSRVQIWHTEPERDPDYSYISIQF